MKQLVRIGVVVALVLVGCGNLFDPAAAVVAGKKIPVQEVEEALAKYEKSLPYQRLSAQGDPQDLQRSFEQNQLTNLIRRAVIEGEAEERGIEVTEEEIEEETDRIVSQYESESAFQEELKERGIPEEDVPELVEADLLAGKLNDEVTADVTVTDEDIRTFYDENPDRFTQTRTQHILLDDRDEAVAIADQLHAAPPNQVADLFDRLARQHSTDSASAGKGGDLGFRAPGELVEEYEAAAAALDEGEVSDPVRSQFGYHVIRVIARRVTPFDEARAQIEETLLEQQRDLVWQDFLTEAFEEADIRVNSRYGEMDLETRSVVDATSEDIPGGEVVSPAPVPTE